jgi:CysZ protein
MLSSAAAALRQMFDRKFRGVFWLGVAGTVLLFLILLFVLQWAVLYVPDFGFSWMRDAITIGSTFLLSIAFVFMGAPVAQMFASIFIDRVADAVEEKHYPDSRIGGGATFRELLFAGLVFAGLSFVLNLLAFPLQIASLGVGTVVVFFINGYLTGRSFFELAALRHMAARDARALRRQHRVRLFLGGALISLLAMIPILNFFVPLFGAAMMTHEYNKLVRSS